MSLVLARTPLWYAGLGADELAAGRYAFWTASALCLGVSVILWLGLPRTAPNRERARRAGVLPQMVQALAYSRQNPRLALAFAAAFIGRGDFTVIGYFFSLWVTQVGIAEGLSAGQSLARAGMLFGVIQLAAVVWAFAMGMIMDRVNRVTGIALAFGLAAVGYGILGQVSDPFAPGFFGIALLVGAGESSVIVAAGALLGQEARLEHRGPIVGFYSALGAVGILFATSVGGLIFDSVGPSAPFTLMAVLNGVLLVAALILRRRFGLGGNGALRRVLAVLNRCGCLVPGWP
jgi:MFS family permease